MADVLEEKQAKSKAKCAQGDTDNRQFDFRQGVSAADFETQITRIARMS